MRSQARVTTGLGVRPDKRDLQIVAVRDGILIELEAVGASRSNPIEVEATS